jgi:hypothetical protein
LADHQESATVPPFVVHVEGEVAANGSAIALRIVRSEQGPVDICLRTGDVQYMVSVLLALACEAKRRQAPQDADAPPSGAIPLPLSAINIGQDDDNRTFMMVEVGGTALMFGMPPERLQEIGQTLLTLSAAPCDKPS